jgi:protein-disulfide isomerase
MKKYFLQALLTLFFSSAWSLDQLDEKYLIHFGDAQSPVKITQYFSLTCPHCLSLFKDEFEDLKKKYIETKEVYWIFHPVPLDTLTIQAMECLSHLSKKQKVIFLEVLLDTIQQADEDEVVIFLMQEAMKIFKHPIEELADKAYMTKTQSFEDAFEFIKQKDGIHAVPSVEINGILFRKDIPDKSFIERQIKLLTNGNRDEK